MLSPSNRRRAASDIHGRCRRTSRRPGAGSQETDPTAHGRWTPNWSGEPRGHWEGDTLVIESKGFNNWTWNQFGGWNWAADENLHVVERLSLSDADTIRYEFSVSDPTKPWTGVASLNRTGDLMFEYACHEGNYGMEGILRGARMEVDKDKKD